MDIELDQTLVAHLQKEGLASFRIRDIGALHDLVDCERLLVERAQDIFSIIQHERRAKSLRIQKLIFRNDSLDIL